jgi:hypothetical protein
MGIQIHILCLFESYSLPLNIKTIRIYSILNIPAVEVALSIYKTEVQVLQAGLPFFCKGLLVYRAQKGAKHSVPSEDFFSAIFGVVLPVCSLLPA